MPDNTPLNPGSGGDTIATEDIGGVKYPLSKLVLGAHGVNSGPVHAGNPMPVTGTVAATCTGTVAISGTVPVSIAATVAVSGPLTDAQLRASAVPVSAAALPLPTGAATEATLAGIKTGTDKIPASPAQEHTGAASPHAARLSDGAAFYKATTPSDTQPVSAAALPLPAGASTETTLASLNTKVATAKTADLDTGAGVDTVQLVGIALPANGGAVVGGTATNPLKVDGSGAAQPVTDNGASLTVDDGGGSITVDGTVNATCSGSVTANIGTTNGLALDATLTGGTQKAIARGGAKGATSAADVTSTAEGTDHQAVDVQIYHGGTAKDPTAIRALTSADVVTAAQGTAAALSGAWPAKITDGTNTLPTMDVAARAAFMKVTDGTNTQPTADTAARKLFAAVTDGTNTAGVTTAGEVKTSHIDTTAAVSLTAAAQTAALALSSHTTVAIVLTSLGVGGQVVFEASADGGTTWITLFPFDPATGTVLLTAATAAGTWFAQVGGYSNVRCRCSAITSGTITGSIRASYGGAAQFFVAQGVAALASGAWPVKVTDGTNTAAVKAASTAAAATDPAAVVSLSPNSPLVPGTAATNLGKAEDAAAVSGDTGVMALAVRKDAPVAATTSADGDYSQLSADLAGVLWVRHKELPSYIATYRLVSTTSGQVSLTFTFTANTKKQLATIYHTGAATKTVKVRKVSVVVSTGASGVFGFELVRLSATTAPATGNPAITPAAYDPADASAEATCLALPTTAGSESAVESPVSGHIEWNSAAAAASGNSAGLNGEEIILFQADPIRNVKPLIMRAGTAEGYAVNGRCTAAVALRYTVHVEFTEE